MALTGRFVVSLEGTKIQAHEKELVRHNNTAAVLLFTRNFTSPEQLKSLVAAIQKHSEKEDLPIFVDQEGGQIQRFQGNGFRKLESFKSLGHKYLNASSLDEREHLIQQHVETLTCDLGEYGIISLTPVTDLDCGNAVISGKDRAVSDNVELTADIIESYVAKLNACGHSATLKHFPGHGQSYSDGNDDSHLCRPIDNRDINTIMDEDIAPFKRVISKAEAVMPAHILYPQVDPEHTAGFSTIWLQDILKNKLGFNGLIVSDCLSMAGAGEATMLTKAKQALEHTDIAIMCNIPVTEALTVLNQIPNGTLNPTQTAAFKKWTQFGLSKRAEIAGTTLCNGQQII
ncbi:MAG: beta-N-acetylhexosaminidase [Legionellales bacterium]|jgi:beta-N-acetylhexosaminidase|nr:beta-N-acetylhexosaminidase [Legionellales bacterium]